MAQLAPPLQAQIDRDLVRALQAWGRLPEISGSFGDWPEDEALDFVFEWTLEEERLRRLEQHASRDELTPDQRRQFHVLMGLVNQHRVLVEQLIG